MVVPFIRIFGDKEAVIRFERGQRRLTNMKPALENVADDIMRVIRATFTSQGRRYGGSWEYLDRETVRDKAREGKDPRILIASQRLMDSWTKRDHDDQRLRVTTRSITLDSAVPYAEVHQEGDEEMGIPARPYIAFDRRDVDRWAKIVERDLLRVMGF